ncbi:MAG: endolytic transglycosylase MltG [Clostridia bacterium]|nr:endolytic transglycosylase MltG [Clostridia bacterium]
MDDRNNINGQGGAEAPRPERAAAPGQPDAPRTDAGHAARRPAEPVKPSDQTQVVGGLTKVTDMPTRQTKAVGDAAKKDAAPAKKKKKAKDSGDSEMSGTVLSLIKCMAYITVVIVVSTLISVFVISAANDVFGFVKSDDIIEVTIPENATLDDIAEILHDNKVIKYEWLFKLYNGRKVSDDEKFCAGTYNVTPMSSYTDLIYEFKEKAPSGVSWITIPEGYTTDEIIDLLVENGIGTREKYVDVINNYDFDYWFIDELGDNWKNTGRIYRLDGYLFPDSYQFYNASSEVTVINKMLARFAAIFTKHYRTSAADLGLTVDEVLILASMIEKEAGEQSEFGNVASVFWNRIRNDGFPYFESDATIAYVLSHESGEHKEVTAADLEIDSPYNSYKHSGFAPGPIANPSNSAILAALNPQDTPYYFFVYDPIERKTLFATYKEEHDANVYAIAQKIAENGQTE